MIPRPPKSTLSSSSAASDVYKRQDSFCPMMQEPIQVRTGLMGPSSGSMHNAAARIQTWFRALHPPIGSNTWDQLEPSQSAGTVQATLRHHGRRQHARVRRCVEASSPGRCPRRNTNLVPDWPVPLNVASPKLCLLWMQSTRAAELECKARRHGSNSLSPEQIKQLLLCEDGESLCAKLSKLEGNVPVNELALLTNLAASTLKVRGSQLAHSLLRWASEMLSSPELSSDAQQQLRCLTLDNTALVLFEAGERARALEAILKALQYESQQGADSPGVAGCHLHVACIQEALEDCPGAMMHAETARRLAQATGDVLLRAVAHHALAVLKVKVGDIHGAAIDATHSLSLATTMLPKGDAEHPMLFRAIQNTQQAVIKIAKQALVDSPHSSSV
eukprot:TRINITY_DN19575_c0_g1_i2.p1 TRINITY_DN19575_c0_g1~~TRINITY_DN19575_c0_g1_i2.p1  ORF type:complete len:389 (+),score=93.37 TRINITY_DN19575_c0_g1_i2:66-1232(+)